MTRPRLGPRKRPRLGAPQGSAKSTPAATDDPRARQRDGHARRARHAVAADGAYGPSRISLSICASGSSCSTALAPRATAFAARRARRASRVWRRCTRSSNSSFEYSSRTSPRVESSSRLGGRARGCRTGSRRSRRPQHLQRCAVTNTAGWSRRVRTAASLCKSVRTATPPRFAWTLPSQELPIRRQPVVDAYSCHWHQKLVFPALLRKALRAHCC